MKKKIRNLSHVQIIALGFFLLILLGTLLLCTPFATANGEGAKFVDALFTATSASCVTGLVTLDTGTFWSPFGQGVILFLIQIGGLGVITISTLFFMLFRRRMGLRQREVMSESINSSSIGGILKLTRHILLGTLVLEGCGAVIFTLRYFLHYHFPLSKSLWLGIFHSISSFCNAGFDLNGNFSSFTAYADDPIICITIMTLVVLGGLGFFVWEDIASNKFSWKRYQLHTKIVLFTSACLILIPTILFFILEQNATHRDMPLSQQILTSFFDAVSPRTAGMNLTDTASLTSPSILLTCILMFVGGSPSSTAGGIKTTTLFVLLIFALSTIRKDRYVGVFGRRIPEDNVKKAFSVFMVNLTLVLTGIFLIGAFEPYLYFKSIVFEGFSAIGTVGMSMGITRDLASASKIILILLMYCGRIGSISFGSALIEKKAPPPITAPYESITIG